MGFGSLNLYAESLRTTQSVRGSITISYFVGLNVHQSPSNRKEDCRVKKKAKTGGLSLLCHSEHCVRTDNLDDHSVNDGKCDGVCEDVKEQSLESRDLHFLDV